jgi:hypothetical protein
MKKNTIVIISLSIVATLIILFVVVPIFLARTPSSAGKQKATVAQVKAEISNLRSAFEMAYDKNDYSFAGLCTSNINGIDTLLANIAKKNTVGTSGVRCIAESQKYAISSVLPDGTYLCVDSYGNKVATTTLHTGTKCK